MRQAGEVKPGSTEVGEGDPMGRGGGPEEGVEQGIAAGDNEAEKVKWTEIEHEGILNRGEVVQQENWGEAL